MKKGALLIISIVFLSVLFLSETVEGARIFTAQNITYKYNVMTLESGINVDVPFLCPTQPTTDVVRMGIFENVEKISYTNVTGYYESLPNYPFEMVGNLTTLVWYEKYTVNMSSPAIWTCPCNYLIHNEHTAGADNVTALVWWGGFCGLMTATQGSDGRWIAPCLGLTPRADITIYYCDRYDAWPDSCNSGGWLVTSTTDDPGLFNLFNLTNGEIYYFLSASDYLNFSLGISCVEDLGKEVVINVFEDTNNWGLSGVLVNLTHRDTGTTLELTTDSNGIGIFNLTLTGAWSIRAEKEGYSQKYPYYGSDFYYWGEATGLTISMHDLTTSAASLDVWICTHNITYSEGSLAIYGLPGYGTRTAELRCLPLDNAKVQISGNATATKYTGIEGRASFYDLTVDKTYWIAVNLTGYSVISPTWNSSLLITDMDYKLYRVIMVKSEHIEGEKEKEPTEEAKEIQKDIAEASTWVGTLIPSGLKAGLWIIFQTIVSGGLAMRAGWQMGGISIIGLTLAGAISGWLPSWIAIILVIFSGFLLSKGFISIFRGD